MDSVVNQSFADFEVIVVDDESPDNSMQIVQRYVDACPGKIRVIHQKNTRQGGARNRGVLEAKGEYILFLDSDDFIHPDTLKIVDGYLNAEPCDILVFRYVPVAEDGTELGVSEFNGLEPGLYHPSEDAEILRLPFGPVNKAFRREFYLESGVRFPEKVIYEDAIVRLLYAKAASVLVCDDCLYYYVQSQNSTMRQKISDRMLDIIAVTDQVLQAFQNEGLYTKFKDTLERSLIWGVLNIINIICQWELDNPLLITLADYIVETFPDYQTNPKIEKGLRYCLNLLAEHKFKQYRLHFLTIPGIKAKLLKLPFISKLNQIRKRYMH